MRHHSGGQRAERASFFRHSVAADTLCSESHVDAIENWRGKSVDTPGKYVDECFFIAPIGADDSDIRKRSDGVLTFIVQKAAEEFGLTAVRADKISSPGQINLQVIEHVLGARAAVADLTGLNPNVFYEMAVRHTAKLPLVIIAEKGTDLPFDIAQMRTIFFDHTDLGDADLCRRSIIEQLREALENGVVDSPISTAVDLSQLSAGGAADRSIAELVTTVETLARGQRDLADRIEYSMMNWDRERIPPPLVDDLFRAVQEMEHRLGAGDDGVDAAVERVREAALYLETISGSGKRRNIRSHSRPRTLSGDDTPTT